MIDRRSCHGTVYRQFFGHREIENVPEIERTLEAIITELIQTKNYVEFLVGREGDFDILVSSVIRRVKRQIAYGNCSLIWVLPYRKAESCHNEKEFLTYYDDVEICEPSAKAYYKAALQIRNRCMVDRFDLIICCIRHKSGGAFQTVKYAEKKGKMIINMADRSKGGLSSTE